MSPVELSPASQTTPSSSTLWAQPSKEWVIPAKPKPGRKPKRGTNTATVPENDHEDVPSGCRRVQNRTAQRAFRERKQTQLVELQARLHSYERGEVERNVALQNIAKKMKDENEELRKENQTLKEKIAQLEQERESFPHKDKKRAYDDASMSSLGFPLKDNYASKRAKVDEDKQGLSPSVIPIPPSSSSQASSPGRHENQYQHTNLPAPLSISNPISFTTANKTTNNSDENIIESLTCILCDPDMPCVCREVAVEHRASSGLSENLDQQSAVLLDHSVHYNIPPFSSINIPDNLPAFQAPVPIRRKAGASRENVFPVTPIAGASSSLAPKCSGDPDNCIACADDNFGKAFCQAIGHTLNSPLACADCPKRTDQTDKVLVGGCCGDISKCGSCGIAPIVSSTTASCRPETIPTDDAWRQLKSHPNVAFADLTLLAEVVARRSKCAGSRVVISPSPEFATPDGSTSLSHQKPVLAEENPTSGPHEHFRQERRQRDSPPQLVPQHVLIECGRRRMREVNADSVKEALRLLDQKFAHTR